ncbi:hypothetical protein [Salinispora arenicola]|uniref:hypothetical protein n=1 Tax=Salinispora arenicola TaxID=168697 RepID=UPI0027DD1882|nr:hypothetical protein [Salinispora arenicola]
MTTRVTSHLDRAGRLGGWPGDPLAAADLGEVWLHLPTGAAGLIGIRPHHDNGPVPARGFRLLEATTPVPLPAGHRFARRTTAEVEAVLRAEGWRVISRADAATRLRAAGYRLGTRRAAGRLLYADDADDTTWGKHCSGYCVKAFTAPIHPRPASRRRAERRQPLRAVRAPRRPLPEGKSEHRTPGALPVALPITRSSHDEPDDHPPLVPYPARKRRRSRPVEATHRRT